VHDMIGKTGSFAEQFVVGGVTQFVEGRQVCWAVSMTSGAIYHRVDSLQSLAIRRPGETAPRTGGVRQTSDDGGTVDVLQSCVTEPTSPTHTCNAYIDVTSCWTCWLTDRSFLMLTPSIFMQLLRRIPGRGARSTAVCRRLCDHGT